MWLALIKEPFQRNVSFQGTNICTISFGMKFVNLFRNIVSHPNSIHVLIKSKFILGFTTDFASSRFELMINRNK